MGTGAQNMKTGLYTLSTTENGSESAKHETGSDALGTTEKITKHEN
jgi:hypothetical protein